MMILGENIKDKFLILLKSKGFEIPYYYVKPISNEKFGLELKIQKDGLLFDVSFEEDCTPDLNLEDTESEYFPIKITCDVTPHIQIKHSVFVKSVLSDEDIIHACDLLDEIEKKISQVYVPNQNVFLSLEESLKPYESNV